MTALSIETTLATLETDLQTRIGPTLPELEALGEIRDTATYTRVAAIGQDAHIFDQQIERAFEPWKADARALHLAICAEERAYREVPQRIKQLAGALCLAWDTAEDQRRRDEEERQRVLAEARALMEREAEVEQLREVAAATHDTELAAEADLVAREPITVAPTRVPSTRGRAVTRNAPKHKPTYDASCDDVQTLVLAVARPLIVREIARVLGDEAADETKPAELRTVCRELEARLLRQLAALPHVPLAAVEPSAAWLKVEATRAKEQFSVPGCSLKTDTKTSFSRR